MNEDIPKTDRLPASRAGLLWRVCTFSFSNASLTGFADRVGGGKGVEEGASAIVCRA